MLTICSTFKVNQVSHWKMIICFCILLKSCSDCDKRFGYTESSTHTENWQAVWEWEVTTGRTLEEAREIIGMIYSHWSDCWRWPLGQYFVLSPSLKNCRIYYVKTLQIFRTSGLFFLLYNNLNLLSLFYAAFCQIYHSGPLMSLVNFDVLSLIHTSRFFRYSWVLMWNDTVYKTKWSGLELLKSRHSHFHTSFHPCVQYYTLFLLLQTWPEASAL